ncbi:SpoIIE family protein phosphatase [Leptospira sp. 201903071]|uniref:PP2C family protein-serine/threonine phosphatase n=1 Tax=Leptospira ainazelensis TaxID=2810034 RepID=UPI001964B28B|nr:SpoIIE family protein phosphatase [Leptospira ainazelensis]MBM9498715.1 SpoIIE family protein phosphatase [Leptospira ainazelensis]
MKKSLRLQIIVIYTILTVVNLTFVAVMIFENQTDLLISNFTLESDRVAREILKKIESFGNVDYQDSSQINEFQSKLFSIGLSNFSVLEIEDSSLEKTRTLLSNGAVSPFSDLKSKLSKISSAKAALNTSYDIELDTDQFIVHLIFFLNPKTFLISEIKMREMIDRLRSLYIQLGLLLVWGFTFQILFGIFLYRKIFIRLFLLKEVSETMATGDLKARVSWKQTSQDELDVLGNTFNGMAEKISSQFDALHLKNTQIQTELEIGKNVQECFLPGKRKKFNLLQAHIHYQPMREVSGDIYEIVEINETRSAFFMADATGHGVSAALITSIIHYNMRDILKETINPAEVLGRLSENLFETLQGTFFATGIFFLFEKDGFAYFCSAGHNPIYYFRKTKRTILTLNSTGFVLGIGIPDPYQVLKIRTEPGDKILVYTDGILDAESPAKEQFGDDRLLETFQKYAELPPEELLSRLQTELKSFANHFPDDVTFGILEIS